MLNSAAIARPRVSEMYRDPCRVDDAGPKVAQFLDRVHDQNANPTSPLNRYMEGWAQPELKRILDATASAIGSLIRSSEVSMAGRCTNTSISCRTDSPVQERSVGASLSSCKAQ